MSAFFSECTNFHCFVGNGFQYKMIAACHNFYENLSHNCQVPNDTLALQEQFHGLIHAMNTALRCVVHVRFPSRTEYYYLYDLQIVYSGLCVLLYVIYIISSDISKVNNNSVK